MKKIKTSLLTKSKQPNQNRPKQKRGRRSSPASNLAVSFATNVARNSGVNLKPSSMRRKQSMLIFQSLRRKLPL